MDIGGFGRALSEAYQAASDNAKESFDSMANTVGNATVYAIDGAVYAAEKTVDGVTYVGGKVVEGAVYAAENTVDGVTYVEGRLLMEPYMLQKIQSTE